ncbi:hypothetical protein EDB19DRAFT_1908054 [Suillus lakei]|nr:hypothetical protein EDB19DRAFT_1908054 [Suillus lakei]
MSLPQVLIGHIYSPPTAGKDASIFEWFPHTVETLKGTFLKVAYVLSLQENVLILNTENVYEPVYMDMRKQPNLPQFTVPNSWRQLCVCSDEGDLTIRPVIQKVAELGGNIILMDPGAPLMDHCASLIDPQLNDALIRFDDVASWVDDTEYNGTSFDDDVLTRSSLAGKWTGTDTSVFDIPPSVPAAANAELPYPVPAVGIESEYNAASDMLTPNTNIALPNYVLCDLVVFAKDVQYSKEYIKVTFPVADMCICDAIIHAKQRLITHSMEEHSFRASCKDYIVEMVTFANHTGCPVELGLKCIQGNIATFKPLYMLSGEIIGMVYQEWAKFIRTLKEICGRLAEELEKKNVGGYCLKDYTIETVAPYITQLTGLMVWDSEVTSIMFTCSPSGRYYRQMPILIILVLRILQPPRNYKKSLLDIYPNSYGTLPKNLLASACRTVHDVCNLKTDSHPFPQYLVYFRCQLPECPWTSISSDVLEREIAQQLPLLNAIHLTASTDLYAHELNTWINTQDGMDGWLQDLRYRRICTATDIRESVHLSTYLRSIAAGKNGVDYVIHTCNSLPKDKAQLAILFDTHSSASAVLP